MWMVEPILTCCQTDSKVIHIHVFSANAGDTEITIIGGPFGFLATILDF